MILLSDARHIPLADNSVHAVVTDPPYGLEFMGKEWDELRARASRGKGRDDLKDGYDIGVTTGGKVGIGVKYGAPKKNPRCRKCGRLRFDHEKSRCQCETADFDSRSSEYGLMMQEVFTDWMEEIRRVLRPGGHAVVFGGLRTWHRMACGVEDAGLEIRDCLAWMYGSGFPKSMNIGCRCGESAGSEECESCGGLITWQGWGTALKPAFEPIVLARKPLSQKNVAKNVKRWGTGGLNIAECEIAGEDESRFPANVILDEDAALMLGEPRRFFYCAKANGEDRMGGDHPTVKPVELIKWLVRLVSARGHVVLDPFCGSGTTVEACMALGREFIACDLNQHYLNDLARKRSAQLELFG